MPGVRRISVVGNSGSGKTTLARELAAALGVPHLELDSVYHQAGWQPLPLAEFRARATAFAAGDAWVADGNYSKVIDVIWDRADTVIWVDPPLAVVMGRLLRRTLSRMARRTELWNGNRERLRDLVNPKLSILVWAWTQHRKGRDRFGAALAAPPRPGLEFIRVTTLAQAAALTRRAARN
jgi:adenylate kinase family enzyme